MKTTVIIAKSTPSSNGGFINTLLMAEKIKTALGTKTVQSKVFYKSEEALTENEQIEIELSDFTFTRAVSAEGSMVWMKEKSAFERQGTVHVINNVGADSTF